jgi:hypothetical protein
MKKKETHSKIPKRQELKNFQVPQNYFEQNAIQLKQIAKEVPQKETKVIAFKPLVSWLSAAAVITLIVFGVVNRKQMNSSALSEDDIFALMDVGYVSFSEYELLNSLELDDVTWENISQDDAQNYLEESDLYYLEENLLYESY